MTQPTPAPIQTLPRPLATPQDVATFLQIDRDRLSQMRSKGDGPPFIKLGRDVRYRWRDVTDWLESNLRTSARASA